jgi:oxygen-independent coproporphyrinogen-3 oxidase
MNSKDEQSVFPRIRESQQKILAYSANLVVTTQGARDSLSIEEKMPHLALYLHIPFCRSRCSYCDFNTYVGEEALQQRYVRALIQEISGQGARLAAARGPRCAVHSVFLGGGTPTALPARQITSILEACALHFALQPDAEITIEANPSTVTQTNLADLRSAGVNRLSIGVQSFRDEELALLGRLHDAATARRAFGLARAAGFKNISLDLIYGLPQQGVHQWRESLSAAIALGPEHLSLYALGVEPGTPLHNDVARGRYPRPDPDVAAAQYELAEAMLADAGFVHYEISNWAHGCLDLACRHNLTYWRNEPYLGLGAGAHSWVDGYRFANVRHPLDYAQRLETGRPEGDHLWSPAVRRRLTERISEELEMAETMILGLRLVEEGVTDSRFQKRFGQSFRERYAVELQELIGLGLLEDSGNAVRLTARGRLLGNEVFQRFLPD